jgi:hypothetical protein
LERKMQADQPRKRIHWSLPGVHLQQAVIEHDPARSTSWTGISQSRIGSRSRCSTAIVRVLNCRVNRKVSDTSHGILWSGDLSARNRSSRSDSAGNTGRNQGGVQSISRTSSVGAHSEQWCCRDANQLD